MTANTFIEEAKSEGIVRYVVGAVIAKEGTVLLLRRKMDDFMGGIYELPSGQVANGESLESALSREVLEETGLKIVEVCRHLSNFDYESKSGTRTRQFNFEVSVCLVSAVQLTEHDAHAWVGMRDIGHYEVTPSVRKVLDAFWNESGI
ncbi:MAG: NUDIX domain-containing protein [Gemmatimonadetes bacterium]|nr:NUDIX domain-containing protein [Gemmatimonadota bacterium]